MAALPGYAEVLQKIGQESGQFSLTGISTDETRAKLARHIFQYCEKAGSIPMMRKLTGVFVELSDMDDDGRAYGCLLLLPSIA